MLELDEFLKVNNIDQELLFNAVYLDIREIIFQNICKKMKKDGEFKQKVRTRFYKMDNVGATKKIVADVCQCTLPDKDLLWMKDCLLAFLNKGDTRKKITDEEKANILSKQQYRCAICGDTISAMTVQIDHIIPWDFVGDELQNNLQGLCPTCNSTKSNHVAIAMTNLIFRRVI